MDNLLKQLCVALGINKMMLLPGAGIRECTNTYTECALALLKGMQNLPLFLGHDHQALHNQKATIIQTINTFYSALIKWINTQTSADPLHLHGLNEEHDWTYDDYRESTEEYFDTCKTFIETNLSNELFSMNESDTESEVLTIRNTALEQLKKVYKFCIRARSAFRLTDEHYNEALFASLLQPSENLAQGQRAIQILLDTLERVLVSQYTLPSLLNRYQDPLAHVASCWITFARQLERSGTLETKKPLLPDYLADRAKASTSTEPVQASNARIRDNAFRKSLRIETGALHEINGDNSSERAARRAPSIFPTVANSPTVKAEGDVVAATGPEVGPDSPTA